MKNKEKFEDKIIDFACSEEHIAVDAKGEIVACWSLPCENCKLYTRSCFSCKRAFKEWLEEECVESLMISRKDIRLLECIKGGYKYIARDYDGDIFLYINKPEKGFGVWYSKGEKGECVSIKSFDVCFPMIKREDKEPWLIEALKHLQVVDHY